MGKNRPVCNFEALRTGNQDARIKIQGKKWFKAKKLFSGLHSGQKTEFQMQVLVYGQAVYLAGSRSARGELMIVATNQHPKNAVAIYLRRWEIENLFQCLKSRGFRFEATHLVDRQRIKKMMGLLAIGCGFAHKTGEWQATIKPIRFCKHRDGLRPQSSYLRYGLDYIREILLNPLKKLADFRRILRLLLPNPPQPAFIS